MSPYFTSWAADAPITWREYLSSLTLYFYSSLCVVMYLRLESLRLTVVGRRTPARTNLVVYCLRVLLWFCTPSMPKISCAVCGVSSQNSNTFRCFAVKRTWLLLNSAWLLFGSTWLLFASALLLFLSALLLFQLAWLLFEVALLLFPRGLTLFLHDR